MKKIVFSLGIIAVVAALVVGSTTAFFSDSETSMGNIFTAGSIDLKIDHTQSTYNGQSCEGNCVETGSDLILNGNFETPIVVDNGGQYQVYPNASLTSWTVDAGPGLELQRTSVAGDPHGGVQLAELDSTGSSAISQTIATTAGSKYRLHLWYSPRPGIPAGNNTIGLTVTANNATVLASDTLGAAQAGAGNTSWTEYIYEFTALDGSTKVTFTDQGASDSLGGYLDDVSMRLVECSAGEFDFGGTCHLWEAKDLAEGDTFWNFTDVKPGDYGTTTISMHVTSNDAYACMTTDGVDNENSLLGPEIEAGDLGPADGPNGELSQYLHMFVWEDNGDGIFQNVEPILAGPNATITAALTQPMTIAATSTEYLGIAWCAGTQTVDGDGTIHCDGSGDHNIAQSDSYVADMSFYAVQQRNNPNFSCTAID